MCCMLQGGVGAYMSAVCLLFDKEWFHHFVQKVEVAARAVDAKKRVDFMWCECVVGVRDVSEVEHVEPPRRLRVPASVQHCAGREEEPYSLRELSTQFVCSLWKASAFLL